MTADIFGSHNLKEGGATGIQWVESRDADKHLQGKGQSHQNKESSNPKCQQFQSWETIN